jgi:hypothetical protein
MKKIVKVAAKKAAAPKVVKTAVVPKEEVKKEVVKAAKPKTQRVTFSVRAKEGSKVFVAGSFNDWDPTAKQLVDK